ncbi:hypothetical protein AQ490_26280 [Wenjunlia vitaminophila]|uniref:Secreted protein n=1 Tax=Wenjunlia vitaminophila TaxID=76728 RepID=A0A0T6LQV3_WENVI|nr:hypothetical protein [Wenjunlia vitaminophila]KRV48172.1 hypothetical protein AQ490_26280 [Wenjunlia vitaminophila]
MPGTRSRSRRRWTVLLLSGVAVLDVALVPAAAAAADPGRPVAPAPAVHWKADLSDVDADDVNVRHAHGSLRLRAPDQRTASLGGAGHGSQVLTPRTLTRPVNRVTAALDADVPDGAAVVVDVRGRDRDARWTEWHRASSGDRAVARLPHAVTTVQVRLTLRDPSGLVRVHGLALTADTDGSPGTRAVTAPVTYRLFATREGLVGGTTANGHVIQPDDHFVALPSRRGLSPKDGWDYAVEVCGPARCETAPVWDVGPWNTRDDYWNPADQREMWWDLPQGRPEAQAAYLEGYNGGLDEFGRRVANPAGIDLADGTFYNVGLNDNGWVDVTFLWTGEQAGTWFPTWGSDVRVRQQPTTASATLTTLPPAARVRVECQAHGERITYDGITNDAWSYLPDYGGYVSNIFIDVEDAWLPGVPEC